MNIRQNALFVKKTLQRVIQPGFDSRICVDSGMETRFFNSIKCVMKNSTRTRFALLMIAVLASPLMAFTLRGGDSFEIYVGKTLALQQFLHMDKAVKTVDLSTAAATDEIRVTFNHCGQTGTNRKIALKDNLQVLKEWKFADIKPGGSPAMAIPVKEIAALQKNLKGKNLSLFYSSDLMKDGRVLATISSGSAQARAK